MGLVPNYTGNFLAMSSELGVQTNLSDLLISVIT